MRAPITVSPPNNALGYRVRDLLGKRGRFVRLLCESAYHRQQKAYEQYRNDIERSRHPSCLHSVDFDRAARGLTLIPIKHHG